MINSTSIPERNSSIDIFRMICAIMVIAIHTHPLTDINKIGGFVATYILPKIAVPFFFCVAGYYYTESLLSNRNPFIKSIKSLLREYLIWSFVYIFISFLSNVIKDHQPINIFLKNTIFNFFIAGSSYHLWYFPALFFSITLVSFFNKINSLKVLAAFSVPLYIIGLLGCSYYRIGIQIPILKSLITSPYFTLIRQIVMMGLPFFILGYFLNITKEKWYKLSNKSLFIKWAIISVLYLIEIVLVVKFKIQINIVITLFLYPLLAVTMMILLKYRLSEKALLAHKARRIASFTYYSHPIFITLLSISGRFVANVEIGPTPMFLMTSILTTIFGLILIKIDNKWINKIFLGS